MDRVDVGALAEGMVIADRFRIERKVAQGGMGVVYKAKDSISGIPIALKIVSCNAEQPDVAARFEYEAETLTRLSHPRVVAYVAHGMADSGHCYLAMQWLEGYDLGQRMSSGPLSIRTCRRLFEKLCEALAYVHENGVIHRDIKPANIFLRDGNLDDPVLVDFGIARGIERHLSLTRTGAVLGTPNYMSPEQAKGLAEITPSTDIFSLGCVMYECLTGTAPFAADHVSAVLAKILFDRPKAVSHIRPSVPRPYDDVLARTLNKDPRFRFINAKVLLENIRQLPDIGVDVSTTMPTIDLLPNSGIMDAEQALVSVVLCLPGGAGPESHSPENKAGDHLDSVKMQLSRFGAEIERMADGSILATIIAKSSATDQARIAARCALFLRDNYNNDRISIATGRGQWQGTMPVGEAVERAAGLLRAYERDKAGEEGIFLDEVTAGLLGARFDIRALKKGLFELLLERPPEDTGRLLLGKPTPCVGREPELAQLEASFRNCVDEAECNSIILISVAGMGKSRIRIEFTRRIQEKYPSARILSGFGDPLSMGSPYGLLGQALRNHAGIRTGSPISEQRDRLMETLCAAIEESDKKRVAEFLGELCGIPFPGEESAMLHAARRDPKAMSEQIEHAFFDYITGVCEISPVLIVLEDLQWGDALTIQLLDMVLREKHDLPLLILAFARPELNDAYPMLWKGRMQEISLRPLNKKVCERYVEEMLGDQKLGADTLSRIVVRSAGNPLFLEELIRAASEGRADEIPETVLAMLQARLSRLSPEARRILRNASIFGENFWIGGLEAMMASLMSQSVMLQWLDILVKSEWIEKKRRSQIENEEEYAFRHALARDAAYSLLTEAERVYGHKQAFIFLECTRERDPIALAEHARLGNELGRAIEYYIRAAEESLIRNDLAEAARRAALGVECGAEGWRKGILRAFEALSAYGLVDWGRADRLGAEALSLLVRGHRYWYQVAEKLLQLLPTSGQHDRFEQLIYEIDTAEPLPDARPAQIYVFSTLVGMFGLVGLRDQAERYAAKIETAKGLLEVEDAHVNAIAWMYLSYYRLLMYPDLYSAFVFAQRSRQMFEKTRVLYGMSFLQPALGAIYAGLGDYQSAEESFQYGIRLAEQLRDHALDLANKTVLATVFSRIWSGPKLDEIRNLAVLLKDQAQTDSYKALAHTSLAIVHFRSGELEQAEKEGRIACQLNIVSPPTLPLSMMILVDTLIALGRFDEALSTVAEGLLLLKRTRGLGAFEIPFRVAAANAYFQAGKEDEGKAFLKDTLQEIEKRSNQIEDPFLKNCYLHQNIDTLRAFELAKKWLPSGH